jgi:hypothetical protein
LRASQGRGRSGRTIGGLGAKIEKLRGQEEQNEDGVEDEYGECESILKSALKSFEEVALYKRF